MLTIAEQLGRDAVANLVHQAKGAPAESKQTRPATGSRWEQIEAERQARKVKREEEAAAAQAEAAQAIRISAVELQRLTRAPEEMRGRGWHREQKSIRID
jgi:hypothetical protein